MQKSFIEDFFERMNEKLFFALVILLQFVFIFQGLDFTESGFIAVFYQRIFSDPATVQYNFTHWFTGIIGGTWLKLFPGLGLLGLRIAGVICTTITFAISYNLLKKYLQTGSLRLGLFLLILFLGTSPRELNYNDISALFFMCAAWFLFMGLTRQKYSRLFIAGMFVSVNMFSRVPNVLDLILLVAICFSGYVNRVPLRQIVNHSVLFIGGFLVMTSALFLLMRMMHQDTIFFNSLDLQGPTTGGPENPRSLYQMFKLYTVHYGEALIVSIITLLALWSFAAVWRRLKSMIPSWKEFWPVVKYGILILLAAICVYRAWKDPDFGFYLFLFYAGTSGIVGFLIISGRQSNDMQVLTAIGCIMLLVLPAGSKFVLMSSGKYAVWIMVPITVDYLLNIRSLSSSVTVSENNRHTYEQVIHPVQMNSLRNGSIFLTLIYILSVSYFYPYSDRSNRTKMKYEVSSPKASGIYTTRHRAEVISGLLAASAKYVRPDDFVLAYDCLPMYYYLTDTRPYMHNSWLWLYDDRVFKEQLKKSVQATHICPVVIMQKRSTIANNWPDNYGENYRFREQTLASMQTFFKAYQYTEVWQDDFFRLLVPAVKNLPVPASEPSDGN